MSYRILNGKRKGALDDVYDAKCKKIGEITRKR